MELGAYFDDFPERDWATEPLDTHGSVRFAVIGLGGYARNNALAALEAADYCEPTVVVSGSKAKADRVVDERGLQQALTYDEFRSGVASGSYDAVYVSTPTAHHLDYVEIAARIGKDVLCEKPIEATSDRATRMIQVCKKAGVELMIAYRMQFDPTVRRMREMIRDGVIGEPVHVHSSLSLHILELDTAWRFDPDTAGGGVLMEDGIYPLNTSRFLLDSDPIAVVGQTRSPDEEFDEVEEHVSFELTFPQGAVAACTSSYRAHPDSHLRITGTEGYLELESAFFSGDRRVLTVERSGRRLETTGRPVDEVVEEFDYFAHCIQSNTAPSPDGEHGLVDLEVMDAIYQSARNDERMHL